VVRTRTDASLHEQLYSLAHISATRCPPRTACSQHFVLGSMEAVLPSPLKHVQVPALSGQFPHAHSSTARCPSSAAASQRVPIIPRAVVFPSPLQHLQVSAPSGMCRCPLIPRAAMLPHPVQHLQMPIPSGTVTTHVRLVPRAAAVLPRPPQQRATRSPLSRAPGGCSNGRGSTAAIVTPQRVRAPLRKGAWRFDRA